MDTLAALKLQIEWGADEALGDAPVDRTRPAPAAAIPQPSTPAARAGQAAAAATTLDALRAAVAGFTECALSATATNLVFADGNPSAGLVLIGDVPGPEEDLTGKPFAGAAGQLLDRMLASIQLDRGACLLTNVVPWRPPGNRPPSPAEVAMCVPFLRRHLELLRPACVVLLGTLPVQALLGPQANLRRLRGAWRDLDIGGRTVLTMPMLHPLQLLQSPAAKKLAWADLIALHRKLHAIK